MAKKAVIGKTKKIEFGGKKWEVPTVIPPKVVRNHGGLTKISKLFENGDKNPEATYDNMVEIIIDTFGEDSEIVDYALETYETVFQFAAAWLGEPDDEETSPEK